MGPVTDATNTRGSDGAVTCGFHNTPELLGTLRIERTPVGGCRNQHAVDIEEQRGPSATIIDSGGLVLRDAARVAEGVELGLAAVVVVTAAQNKRGYVTNMSLWLTCYHGQRVIRTKILLLPRQKSLYQLK